MNTYVLFTDDYFHLQVATSDAGHNKHQSPLYSRLRLRGDKSPRSEDLEADDEQGDKTDNDHDSLNLSESSSVTSLVAAGGSFSAIFRVCSN